MFLVLTRDSGFHRVDFVSIWGSVLDHMERESVD